MKVGVFEEAPSRSLRSQPGWIIDMVKCVFLQGEFISSTVLLLHVVDCDVKTLYCSGFIALSLRHVLINVLDPRNQVSVINPGV